MDKKRVIIVILMVIVVVALVSSTIGRSIMQGKQPGIVSFASIHFSGYLFFIVLPVEALVPYYLSQGHPGMVLIIIAVITALIAQILDYSFGYLFSEKIIDNLIGKWRYQKAKNTLEKYGDWAVLIFNLFPLSSPILILAAGMVRLKLPRLLMFSFVGLTVKYSVLVIIFSTIY